jgi:hypothetical protein
MVSLLLTAKFIVIISIRIVEEIYSSEALVPT